MTYTTGQVHKLLADYQRRAQGARMTPRDDVLVQRAAPLHEAPWAASSCVWADIETAMRALPFNWEKILWQTVCMGESSARNGTKRYDWRRQVADWWGITPGDVNKVVKDAIQEICDSLNGPVFNHEREADTVNENDTRLLPDLVDNANKGLWAKIRPRG